ncbi:uncharacterized protein Tco025E_05199 [Trypanosoma conorhini]|uniref:Nodulin-like domain-containing protein n=1 Tax=Trypanosoma conorhini TaxID=83891 RepID=A0A422PFM7_9TRYP|nr:uncharacterized protein Tco025E_05199 [Trypanosoma conorhini]RNF16516.1 hypothetical protein Tco025E_05199 [Trypanosoma conorhini]
MSNVEEAPTGFPQEEEEALRGDEDVADIVKVETFRDNLAPLSEVKRFGIVSVAVFGSIAASFAHFFNLFSGELEKKYGLTQKDLSTVGTVGTVFCFFTLPYGFVYDYFGPIPIFGIATVFFPIGALLLALSFNGFVYATVVRLSVFNAILNIGTIMFDIGIQMTMLSLFPSSRGGIVAIAKSFNGLGSPIVAAIQLAFFNGRPDHFFYFLMALVVVIAVTCMFVVRLPPYHLTGYQQTHLSEEEKQRRLTTRAQYLRQKTPIPRFAVGLFFVIVLIVFMPLEGALVVSYDLGKRYRVAFAVVAIVLVLLNCTLMPLPLKILEREWWSRRRQRDAEAPTQDPQKERLSNETPERLTEDESSEKKSTAGVETDVDYIAPQYQTTFLQSACTLRLWAVLWSLFATVGAETVLMLNASYIFAALSGEKVSPSLRTLLTVLDGVGSAVGRLMMSGFEMWSQKKKPEDRIPMTMALFIPASVMVVALVLILSVPKAALPLPYVLGALANGIRAGVVVLMMRTIYARDVAKHYNFCFLSTVFATILLNRFTYGEWYTREADKLGTRVCYERRCVVMPLALMLGINCTAFISSVYVHLSYRSFSRKTLAERRRIKEAAARPTAVAPDGQAVAANPLQPSLPFPSTALSP